MRLQGPWEPVRPQSGASLTLQGPAVGTGEGTSGKRTEAQGGSRLPPSGGQRALLLRAAVRPWGPLGARRPLPGQAVGHQLQPPQSANPALAAGGGGRTFLLEKSVSFIQQKSAGRKTPSGGARGGGLAAGVRVNRGPGSGQGLGGRLCSASPGFLPPHETGFSSLFFVGRKGQKTPPAPAGSGRQEKFCLQLPQKRGF